MKLWIAFGVSWILYRLDCGCDSSAILIPELLGLSKKIAVAHGWSFEDVGGERCSESFRGPATNSSLVAGATIISSKNINFGIMDHRMDLRPPTEEMLSKLIYVKWCAELLALEVMRTWWRIEHRWSWRKTMVQHGDAPTACWLWNCFLMFSPEDIRVIASIPKNHGARCFSLLTFVGTAPPLCSLRFWWLTFVQ